MLVSLYKAPKCGALCYQPFAITLGSVLGGIELVEDWTGVDSNSSAVVEYRLEVVGSH